MKERGKKIIIDLSFIIILFITLSSLVFVFYKESVSNDGILNGFYSAVLIMFFIPFIIAECDIFYICLLYTSRCV